jgi:hypothetical protein
MDNNLASSPTQAGFLNEHFQKLGTPLAIFKPDPLRLGVGAMAGLAMCGFGLLLAGVAVSRDTKNFAHPQLERWGTAGIGGMIVLGGVVLWAWLWATRRFRVLVCPGGLIQVRGNASDAFAWEEIASVHERTTQVKLLKGPAPLVPKAASKVYWVTRIDGASIRFDADKVKGAERLRAMIRTEAARRAIPWTEDTIVV